MELGLARFEPFLDETPYRILSRHPKGRLIALQVLTSHPLARTTAWFGALWDGETGKLVWEPVGRQDDWEWWADLSPGAYLEDDAPARIGECPMGVFEIIDWDTRTVRQIPVMVDLPPGWRPPGTGGPPEELMADPIFIDREHFQWLAPTGERRVYSIWEYRRRPLFKRICYERYHEE